MHPLSLREVRPFDLMFMNLAMPVMDELTCLASLHQCRPQTKVLVVTGHAAETVTWGREPCLPQEVLRKPYSLAQLPRHVRQALGGGQTDV
ncbi:hypothetical protein DFAR_2690042 [Desulfarculales bacterium]